MAPAKGRQVELALGHWKAVGSSSIVEGSGLGDAWPQGLGVGGNRAEVAEAGMLPRWGGDSRPHPG